MVPPTESYSRRPHELTRMSALNCTLLHSLVAIKFASPVTVFSSEVFRILKTRGDGQGWFPSLSHPLTPVLALALALSLPPLLTPTF